MIAYGVLNTTNFSDCDVTLPNWSHTSRIVNEYEQEIPQSKTADNPMALRGRAAQPPRDTRKTYQAKHTALSSPLR